MLLQCNRSRVLRVPGSSSSDLISFGAFYLMSAETPTARNQRMTEALRQPVSDRNRGMLPPPYEVTPLVTHIQNQLYESLSAENPDFNIFHYINNQLQSYLDLTEFHIKNLDKVPYPRTIWPYAERRISFYFY